jgi:hypothetical protein
MKEANAAFERDDAERLRRVLASKSKTTRTAASPSLRESFPVLANGNSEVRSTQGLGMTADRRRTVNPLLHLSTSLDRIDTEPLGANRVFRASALACFVPSRMPIFRFLIRESKSGTDFDHEFTRMDRLGENLKVVPLTIGNFEKLTRRGRT